MAPEHALPLGGSQLQRGSCPINGLTFEPVAPWPVLLLAVGLAAGFFVWSARRGVRSLACLRTLISLRLVSLATVFVMLLQPHRRNVVVTLVRPQLAVLVDNSGSMADPVDSGQPTRAERVRQFFAQPALDEAGKDFDVRVFSFDQSVREQPRGLAGIRFDGVGSNLAQALTRTSERFRGQPLAAILLLADGLDTTGLPAPHPERTALGPPVYTFELEKEFVQPLPQPAATLTRVDFPPAVVVNWEAEIRVNIAAQGMSGHSVNVELWREGNKLRDGAATFNENDQTRPVVFNVAQDHIGWVPYEVRLIDPAADKDRSVLPFFINVLDAGRRIIYVQNALGFDFKYLRKAILADPGFQLDAFTRWGDGRIIGVAQPGASGGSVSPPATALDFSAQGLSGCAAVILGDIAPDVPSAGSLEALRQFVDQGGGLVLLGGPNGLAGNFSGTAFEDMLPFKTPAPYREGTFPLEITLTGAHHAILDEFPGQLNELPALPTCNVTDGVALTAETLIEADLGGGVRKPVIVATRFGQGHVVIVLSDTLWRWRLATGGAEPAPYDVFWARLLDWLAPKEQDKHPENSLVLFTEQPTCLMGEKLQIRAILRSASPGATMPATIPLQLQTPDGKTFEYVMRPGASRTFGGKQEPGYGVEVEPDLPGTFRAISKTAIDGVPVEGETRFVATRPASEITGRAINREFLREIAASSGGRFFGLDEWNAWRASLHVTEQRSARTEILDVWNNPLLLAIVCAALAAEWFARKMNSLP